MSAWSERIHVCKYSCYDKRSSQPASITRIKLSFPGEVAGQERQYKETKIASVKTDILVYLDSKSAGILIRTAAATARQATTASIRTRSDSSASVGATTSCFQRRSECCERILAESVELAHALDCNEERLVCCESCITRSSITSRR